MAEFEVPVEKTNILRDFFDKQGAILVHPTHKAALSLPTLTIQNYNGEPIVVILRKFEFTDEGIFRPTMSIFTSDKIAQERWFKLILGDTPDLSKTDSSASNGIEDKRKGMHKTDTRRSELNKALPQATLFDPIGTGLEPFEHLRSNISPQRLRELKKRRYKDAT